MFRLYHQKFQNKAITAYCDNESVVYMLINFRAKLVRPDLQALLREIAQILITNNIQLWIEHIPGEYNITADALSRFLPYPDSNCTISLNPIPTKAKLTLQALADLCCDYVIKHKYLT